MNQNKHEIICFAGCDWWYHNRGLFCPQIITHMTKYCKVLFVNSLGMRIPSLKHDRYAKRKIANKLRSIMHHVKKVENGMYVLSPLSLPFYSNRVGRKLNAFSVFIQVKLTMTLLGFKAPIFFIGCPPALEVIKKLGGEYLIYMRTDLFEEMPGVNKSYVASLDDELTRSADLVLYVNSALYKKGISKNENSLLIGHGVDFDFFASGTESEYIPEDIANIQRPIIGFYGDISNKTSDIALLKFAAEKLPDMSFVFIGSVSTDISGLKKFENVHFLGQKPYTQIPFYGKEFNVAIMPWNQNRWIEFCNPVKVKEYLALGRPIVSMYYPEIEPYSEMVYVARDYETFVSCIHEAVEEHDPAKEDERRNRVKNETWDNKVEQIKAAIEKGLHQKGCPSSRLVM